MEQRKVEMVIFQKEEIKKPVEFTHFLYTKGGWTKTESLPSQFNKIVYLGKCKIDGDMFAAYESQHNLDAVIIIIYKGNLNSGKY